MRRAHWIYLALLGIGGATAWATTDWRACFPIGAGTCTSVTDLLLRGTSTLSQSDALPANTATFGATGLLFEGATVDGNETLLTVADPTADRTITLPDVTGTVVTTGDTGSITSAMITDGTIVNADVNASAAIAYSKLSLTNSIAAGDMGAGAGSQGMLVFCGQQANAGTTFLGSAAEPILFSLDPFLRVVGDATCDGYANATEATADHIVNPDLAIKVTGMLCTVETTPGATTTYTLRSAVADTTAVVSCTIASGGPKTCRANAVTTTNIAANATMTVKAVSTTNESAVGALCRVFYLLP